MFTDSVSASNFDNCKEDAWTVEENRCEHARRPKVAYKCQ